MDVRARLQSDLTAAMKARDAVTVRVLRTLLSAIANAEAVPVTSTRYEPMAGLGAGEAPRRELSDEDIEEILGEELADRRRVAQDLRGRNRRDEAANLEAEIEIVERYRPALG